jgi:hypothetical protein
VTDLAVDSIFQVIEALAVVVGVGFAMIQVRQYRRDKHREAALELLHSFQTPSFARALNIVYSMPDGLSKDEVVEFAGDDFHFVYAMITTWESVGILVHRGEIDLQMVGDFFSGPILLSWRKLENFVVGERKEIHRETVNEWFQWLKERLDEIETETAPIPAYIEYKDWKIPRRSAR